MMVTGGELAALMANQRQLGLPLWQMDGGGWRKRREGGFSLVLLRFFYNHHSMCRCPRRHGDLSIDIGDRQSFTRSICIFVVIDRSTLRIDRVEGGFMAIEELFPLLILFLLLLLRSSVDELERQSTVSNANLRVCEWIIMGASLRVRKWKHNIITIIARNYL